jgi:glyoxylase-like metal-dependent hydrolase (beta-lactamase superfamily II)
MTRFHIINLGITKVYLLESPGGYLLIDTGYPNDFYKFLKAMKRIDVAISEIQYLLLTHHHDDHAGFSSKLVKDTGCKLMVHSEALSYLSEGRSEDISKPLNSCINLVFSVFSLYHGEYKFPPLTVKEDYIVISGDDNEILKNIGIDGKILHTPGHTHDSISVILSDGTAFVGDAAMNILSFCKIKYRPIYIQDIDTVYKSWKKLINHGAKRIFPAHGENFPVEKLQSTLNHFHNQVKK